MLLEKTAINVTAAQAALLPTAFETSKGLALGLSIGLSLLTPALIVGVGLAGWATGRWISARRQETRMQAFRNKRA